MQFSFSKQENGAVEVVVNLENEKFAGKKARFRFLFRAIPTNPSDVTLTFQKPVLEQDFVVSGQRMTFMIPGDQLQGWVYHGVNFNVHYVAQVDIEGFLGMKNEGQATFDDANFFTVYRLGRSEESKPLSPVGGDKINFWKTFLIMSLMQKALVMSAIFAVLFTIFCWVPGPLFFPSTGIAYESVARGTLWIFFFSAAVIAGCYSSAIFYIKLARVEPLPRIKPDSVMRLSQLISARALIDLRGITVECACNVLEKYRYFGGRHGSTAMTDTDAMISFSFFKVDLDYVPKGASIESLVSRSIDFAPVFERLLPCFEVGPDYGVSMEVEIYIRSKEFPDIKAVLPASAFDVRKP